MSTDEYLSSPIKQSQRRWCECNVILMRPKVAAPQGLRHGAIYLAPLSCAHTWAGLSLGSPLRANICFELPVTIHDDHSRPLIDHPIIREN